MKQLLFLTIISILFSSIVYTQISINTDGTDPDDSAMLDVKSTESGLLIPRMTEAERDDITSPADGLLVYVTDDKNFYYFDGSTWILFSGGTDGDWTISGNNIYVQSGIKVGVGTTNPDESLHVQGSIKMNDGKQEEGKVLTTDDSGKGSWERLSPQAIFGDEVPEPDFSCLSIFGDLSIGYWANDIVHSGDYAYVVDAGTDELQIYDVSNPASPSLLNIFGVGTHPRAMTISGNYVYVVDSETNDLRIIDVSNPASPSLTGSLSISGGWYPKSIVVSGSYAYVVVGIVGALKIIDVSTPASPSLISSTYLTHNSNTYDSDPNSIALSGSYAYITDDFVGFFKVVDISNPASPIILTHYYTGYDDSHIAISGSYAYVVDNNSNELQVIDISTPASPSLYANLSIGSSPQDIAISGSYAYVIDAGSDDIKVIDISDPSTPSMIQNLSIGTDPQSMVVSGSYAYVVDYDDEDLKVIRLMCSDFLPLVVDPINGEFGEMEPNWSKSGNNLYSSNTGNVGIGTTNPTNKLTVGGSAKITSALTVEGNGIFNANLGIGTSNPTQKLTVNGNILQTSGDYLSTDQVRARSTGGLKLYDDGGNGLFIENGGFVGLGTVNPSYLFHVKKTAASGSVAAYFEHYGTTYTNYGVLIRAGKDSEAHFLRLHRGVSNEYSGSLGYHSGSLQLFQPSDRRLKTNIRTTQINGLDILENLRVVDYDLKSGEASNITGYIAQEAVESYPTMTYYDEEEALYTISKSQLIPVLHKAIQELSEENEELKERIKIIEILLQNN